MEYELHKFQKNGVLIGVEIISGAYYIRLIRSKNKYYARMKNGKVRIFLSKAILKRAVQDGLVRTLIAIDYI